MLLNIIAQLMSRNRRLSRIPLHFPIRIALQHSSERIVKSLSRITHLCFASQTLVAINMATYTANTAHRSRRYRISSLQRIIAMRAEIMNEAT